MYPPKPMYLPKPMYIPKAMYLHKLMYLPKPFNSKVVEHQKCHQREKEIGHHTRQAGGRVIKAALILDVIFDVKFNLLKMDLIKWKPTQDEDLYFFVAYVAFTHSIKNALDSLVLSAE